MHETKTFGQINAAIYRNIQMLLSSKLNNLDIKNGQYDFFLVISLNEGISQKQLSEYLHIGKSTTAKAIKNLVSKGYVKKIKDEYDNRLEHLYLTELGKKSASEVEEIFSYVNNVAIGALTDGKLNELMIVMQEILDSVISEKNY